MSLKLSDDARAALAGVLAWAGAAALVKHGGLFAPRLPAGARQAGLMALGAAGGAALVALLVPAASRLRGAAIGTGVALCLDGLGFAFAPATIYGVDGASAGSAAAGVNKAAFIFAGAGAGLLGAAFA